MRNVLIAGCMILAGVATGYAAEKNNSLKNIGDKMSYSIGRQIGESIRQSGLDVDLNLVLLGMQEQVAGKPDRVNDEDRQAIATEMQRQRQERQEKQGELNLVEGKKFLDENKAKSGVKVLPSGLQYRVVAAGQGAKPSLKDRVTVQYRGTLIDGTEFDSSYKRGKPATFEVGGVIRGWTEALQMMQEGAKWQLFIPADLAYGERGAGEMIGPNATLIFDVELIKVN